MIQPAPPTPAGHATPREEEDAETIKLLSDHIDDQKELIDHLLKDIEKLEAIIRELRRPVPKEAVRELRMRGQGGAISHPFVQRFWQADGPPSADRGTYRG